MGEKHLQFKNTAPGTHPRFHDPGDKVAYLDEALWRRLAEADTEAAFCDSWLGLQCRMIERVHGGMAVGDFGQSRARSEKGPFTPMAFWPKGVRDCRHLAKVTEQALREGKGVVIRNDRDDAAKGVRFLIAYPVRVHGKVRGAAALEIASRPPAHLQSAMRQLQWGVAWLENRIRRGQAEQDARVRERLKAALELGTAALQEKRFQSAATGFATLLATRLACDRVSIGFVRRNRMRVCALSHSAQFGEQMNLIRSIAAAMDEAADQRQVLVCPEEASEKGNAVLLAHRELSAQNGHGAVCTIPFVTREGRPYGAMTMERAASRPFDAEDIRLCESVAALVAPMLEEKRGNDRPLGAKIAQSLRSQAGKFLGPGHLSRKLTALATIAVVTFFVFATGDYRVTADVLIEGEIQRALVAPYAGYIHEAYARAGDRVRQGQAVCRLDDTDLRLERLRWASQREQHRLQHRQAIGENDLAQVGVLKEQIRQAEAQIGLLDEQISRLAILAPFDGIVVSGDLSQSLGAPVDRGQVLFELAPRDAYRVMLEIDESDVARIRPGQTGVMVLTAMPDTHLAFTVEKITPVSAAKEGRNHFVAEASLTGERGRLRPGMEGVGKVFVDRRKLIWIWTHPLTDWLRLWVWKWWV